MNTNSTGEILRQRRKELGLSLTEVSRITGLDFSHIARAEAGERRATPDFLLRIANALQYNKVEILKLAGYLD